MRVYIVTHGQIEKDTPDPRLTTEGQEQIRRLKGFLPKSIDYLVMGVARRHEQTRLILLGPDRKPDLVSEYAGVIESLSSDRQTMLLSGGATMSLEDYIKERYPMLLKGAKELFQALCARDNKGETILVIASRLIAKAAGIPQAKVESGTLYVFRDGKLIEQHSGA